MRILAIDSATTELIVGVVDDGEPVSETVIADSARAHNEILVPTIKDNLVHAGIDFADLDGVVVGCGPGPYTGLRVGIATAAAIADARRIPLFQVCTHDAIAWQLTTDHPQLEEHEIVVATDARRKEVYWARYKGGNRIAGPDVCRPDALGAEAAAISYPTHLQLPEHLSALPCYPTTLSGAALVAVANLDQPVTTVKPLYLRRPDAKEPAARPKSPAIPDINVTDVV
ncbi:tRNA (adenosine(37)-N6)-threonylcarbamoyltransferase complex dimerization subunit type 1 TsaB [Corynebacterium mustelae]|nr:tRNA (adenosine(37)-N6)-threonylcarbamoyltransferase complex dimerization subunit type 1 TsaB [Corynebacterium mustelae]